MKESFILYTGFYDAIAELTTDEKGTLLEALFCYKLQKELPPLTKSVKIVFTIIRQQIDRDNEKYQNIIERNRLNINKRWNSKDTKNTTGKSGKFSYSDNDTDTDTVNDNDNDTDNVFLGKIKIDWNLFQKHYAEKQSKPITPTEATAKIKHLFELSNGDPATAAAIIRQAIQTGNVNFIRLKNDDSKRNSNEIEQPDTTGW